MKLPAYKMCSIISALIATLVAPSIAQQPTRPPGPRPTPQVQAILTEANAAANANKLDDAEKLYTKALETARTTSDRKGESSTLYRFADLKNRRGQNPQAIEMYEQSIAISQAIKDTAGEISSTTSLGVVYSRTGRSSKGREYFEKTIPLYRSMGDRAGEAQTLSRIAYSYSETHEDEKALDFFKQSLTMSREAGSKRGEAMALNGMGGVYVVQEKLKEGAETLTQALELFKAIGDKYATAAVTGNIGAAYMELGEYPKAKKYADEALVLWQAVGENSGIANTYQLLGKIAGGQKDWATAQAQYEKALPLVETAGNVRYQAKFLKDLGVAMVNQKNYEGALPHFAKAVRLVEGLRSSLAGNFDSQSTFLVSKLPYYYDYMRALLDVGKSSEAFDLAQKTKARSLMDLLVSQRVDLNKSLTPEERQQEADLRKQADTLNAAMVKEGVENEVGSKKRYAALKEELESVERKLQILTDTLNSRHPGVNEKRVAQTATLADIGKQLPANTAVLDYVNTAIDDVRLFVVTNQGGKPKLSVYKVSADYNKLGAQASRLRNACADPRKPYLADSRALYKSLIGPAASQLRGIKRLVICPGGVLWDVPFQALSANNRFLAQQYEIDYAYSSTGALAALSLASKRKTGAKGGILVAANPSFGLAERFGDLEGVPGQRPIESASRPIESASRPIESASRPIESASRPIESASRPLTFPDRAFEAVSRAFESSSRAIESASRAIESASRGKAIPPLPGTEREADALRKLFPQATVLTGERAQESTVKEKAGNYRYLHFATHGFVNDGSPLLSSIVLSKPADAKRDDGFLTAREVYGLQLNAEMTVLSACNTARGENRTGEGVIGLTWALFVAGCPTQVVSQWAVDDASTAKLMESFYSNLIKKKMTKGAALQNASLALLKQPKYRHPYYWAPFVLMGDWR